MKIRKNIYLVGFMGSGKTRQGELLATVLKRDFIDTDQLLTEEYEMSISDIFKKYGEPYFRRLELEKLRQIARTQKELSHLGAERQSTIKPGRFCGSQAKPFIFAAPRNSLLHNFASLKTGLF